MRAYNYWPEKMQDVRQVAEDEVCYEINGISFLANDEIQYQGKSYTAKQLYEEHLNGNI